MTSNTTDQFIFFCVNIGNENLLKEEIKSFYPELALSYSRKGFLTFKNKGVLFDFNTIGQLNVTFATRSGICLGKSHPDTLEDTVLDTLKTYNLDINNCVLHNFRVNSDYLFDRASNFGVGVNKYSADGKLVLNLISLGEKEVWFGAHRVSKGVTRYPNGQVDIKVPDLSPSVAYLKLAEVVELYSLKLNSKDSWLDFGCSPGGSSSYLLSTGANVFGVDTASVDSDISAHARFQFLKSAVQDLSQEQLPDKDINWVHVDMNINPHQAIKEVLRLCKKYNNSLKGIIFTIQIVKMDLIQSIEEFEDIFYDWGFSTMMSRQVPSHKKEYVLIAQRRPKGISSKP